MKKITNINQINTNIEEGRLLIAATAIITTELYKDKTPSEVLEKCSTLKDKINFDYNADDNDVIILSKSELQSGHTRVKWAEGLIKQLPKTHEGRNSWLLNYGIGEEADKLRKEYGVKFIVETQSCETKN